MKYAQDRILQKALPLKLTKTLNASTFVFSFLNIVSLAVLNFLFTTQVYTQGGKWKKLMIEWNEYQENTTTIGFKFLGPKLSLESCFTLCWTI